MAHPQMRYGAVLPAGTATGQLEMALLAESAGWDGVFVWEAAYGPDAWSMLAAMASSRSTDHSVTSRLRPKQGPCGAGFVSRERQTTSTSSRTASLRRRIRWPRPSRSRPGRRLAVPGGWRRAGKHAIRCPTASPQARRAVDSCTGLALPTASESEIDMLRCQPRRVGGSITDGKRGACCSVNELAREEVHPSAAAGGSDDLEVDKPARSGFPDASPIGRRD